MKNTNTLKIWIYAEKSTIFWDIIPCGPLKVNWCFRGTYRLHLQGQRISQARNQHAAGGNLCSALSPAFRLDFSQLILRPWRWRRNVSLKCRLTFSRLHNVIFQQTILSITTTVRTYRRTLHYLLIIICR
jgi:hypothetical protein